MNFGQLMYLIDISKTNSINTTAKRMFASQQAVSESIKRLENELNCTLLNRSKTGTELTADGIYVLNYAVDMVDQYHTLLKHFQKDDEVDQPNGTLSIALAPLSANMLMTDLLLKVHTLQDINVYVKECPMEEIFRQLSSKQIDFGLFYFSEDLYPDIERKITKEQKAQLKLKQLYMDKLVCVMSKNSTYAIHNSITREEFYNQKHTMYYYSTDQFHAEQCLHISNNTTIHQKFMKEEDTLCLMPYHAYKLFYPKKEFSYIPVSDGSPIHYYLVYRDHESKENSLLYKTFIKLTASVIEENL